MHNTLENIATYQKLIEETIGNSTYGTYPNELYQPIDYIMSLGGKRMRPVLVFLGCQLFNDDTSNAVHPALAIELFHNFTLLHDDIMDNAPLRRGKPTVHEKWNKNIAILSGDTMLVKAYQELCKGNTRYQPQLLNIFSETAIKVCEGQQMDMNFETQSKVSIPQYLKMIEYKTAVLLGASLKLGAIVGGADEANAQLLYDFGKHLGIAFQLQDDILDVYAESDKFGKQKGGDIIANKKTFLLLKAIEMSTSNRHLKEELHQWINAPQFDAEEKVEAVTQIFDFLNIKKLAQSEMRKHHESALSLLEKIPVNSSKKQNLITISDGLLKREV